jgi:hypothetical protein
VKETLDINSVEVHPQLSHNGHPMDGALMMDGLVLVHFSPRTIIRPAFPEQPNSQSLSDIKI